MKKKTLALVLALTLLVAGVVGGTLAWLTDQTAEVKNTFTVGDINIGLTETTADYKMVPGNTIAKNPTVTVKADSEAAEAEILAVIEKKEPEVTTKRIK